MRKLLVLGAVLASAVMVSGADAAGSTWTASANGVCTVFLAKAKKEFANPVSVDGLYKFAVHAKTLETQELAQLEAIPGASASGAHALAVLRGDLAEVNAAISAWKRSDQGG